MLDEFEAHRDHLPHPHARYEFAGRGLEAAEGALKVFLHRARPLLERGAAPKELSDALGLSLGQVRFYLYKLELSGTVRVAAAPPPGQAERGEQRGLAARLLGFLRRRWFR